MSKCDPELGLKIHQYLVEKGVESPINYDVYNSKSAEAKIKAITKHMKASLEIMGFDLTNDSVQDTPARVAKMWVSETMSGLDYKNFPKVMTFENKFNSSSMVIERNVQSMSLCSHHIVTIDGIAHVAYIPNKKIIGLSKINRIVDYFSRRPQEAERLTLQIYHALEYILETEDVAVFLNGVHYCVKSRGVSDSNSSTSTVKLGGLFMTDPMVRKEFYDVVHSS
jgi:GTP cyclohydrolase IA